MKTPDDQQWHWAEGNKYAIEAIKTLLLLNGGAAVALLAFFGNRDGAASRGNDIAEATGNSLLLFGFGALAAGLAFVCAYLTQLQYGNRNYVRASVWHAVTYTTVALAVVLFFGGVVFARCAVIGDLD